jgi:hypothetical protein
MTLQHSDGPWSYHGRTECIRDVEGNRIADLSMSRHHGDGHLFAAAPEMLLLLRVFADIPLEKANLGIGPVTAIREARKMLKELDGEA